MTRLIGLAAVLFLQIPPTAPLEIRVYVLDERKRPHALEGWEAFLEIGDRLDGAQREVIPMQLIRPRGADRIEERHRSQTRPIEGGGATAEMVVIQPATPDPFLAGEARPYFKVEYAPGGRLKPEWIASVSFLVRGEVRTARNFRYPFVEPARSTDGGTLRSPVALD